MLYPIELWVPKGGRIYKPGLCQASAICLETRVAQATRFSGASRGIHQPQIFLGRFASKLFPIQFLERVEARADGFFVHEHGLHGRPPQQPQAKAEPR